jgi:ribonuclease BN (tRNA processing enzyme)
VEAGLDFRRLEAVFLTHLHVDHVGDLAGMLLYPWGVRFDDHGPLPPIRVFGPAAPEVDPSSDHLFGRRTIVHPERPFPGTTDLVENIIAGYAYHLNVMPLDTQMPDPSALVRAEDILVSASTGGGRRSPTTVFEDEDIRVSAVPVTHGHAHPALAFRFDTPDSSVVFSGDTTVNDDLIALAQDASVLVHQVADFDYLERQGLSAAERDRMAALHTDVTDVGSIAERARVDELFLTHYLPAEPGAISDTEWARRAARGFSGRTTAGSDGLRRDITRAGVRDPRPR